MTGVLKSSSYTWKYDGGILTTFEKEAKYRRIVQFYNYDMTI